MLTVLLVLTAVLLPALIVAAHEGAKPFDADARARFEARRLPRDVAEAASDARIEAARQRVARRYPNR